MGRTRLRSLRAALGASVSLPDDLRAGVYRAIKRVRVIGLDTARLCGGFNVS